MAMSAEQRNHAIEMKARTKYMRMKNSNDTETARLKLKWEKMDREVLGKLETFLKNANEISDLQSSCVKTTGWYGDAIRPRKREVQKFEKEWKAKSTQWNYFSGGSIDQWETQSQTVLRHTKTRPKTAVSTVERSREHAVRQVASAAAVRPVTMETSVTQAPAVDSVDGQANTGACQFSIRPVSTTNVRNNLSVPVNASDVLLRSKSARARFRPFRSPRLDSETRRKTKVKSDGIRVSLAPTSLHNGYDSNSMDNVQTEIGKDSSKNNYDEIDSVFEDDIQQRKPFSKVTFPVKHKTPSLVSNDKKVRPKSVSFHRQESSLRRRSISSTLHKKKSNNSKSSSASFFQDSDSDEEEEKPDYSKIVITPKQEWKMPRFYVRPEDRHRSEDMFLMRRHALLQRQLAQGVPPPPITKNSKLKINSTLSLAARQSYMNSLVEQNSQQMKNEKKIEQKQNMQEKVDKFLHSIDSFLEKNSNKK